MKHSDSIGALAAALAKAQGTMAGASKDSTNPHFKSRYADLASIVAAIKAPLADNGISYSQALVTNDKDELGCETILMHASGEWLLHEAYYMPVQKADAQGFGSCATYARRYSLAAACGVAPDDDDGNAASSAAPKREPQKEQPRVMTSAEFGKYKVAIAAAPDTATLKQVYSAAYSAAQRLGDEDAMSRFTDLKDVRKEELAEAVKA